jgi:multiple sugar transport system substrate-binding protein
MRVRGASVNAVGLYVAAVLLCGAASCAPAPDRVLTISGSFLGREGDVLRLQLERFRQAHPDLDVALRPTPDAADQRHQMYVQWLNARVSDPDVLQLDVVWTAEFSAAGWIAALDPFTPPVGEFFANAIAANRWRGTLFALPWFADVGMLYWRTDLMPAPPADLDELARLARRAQDHDGLPYGFVWQGARYEGLVTTFVEHLGAFGGSILGDSGEVVVDSDAAVEALTFMRDAIHATGIVPASVLTWQEEQTRFAFQNGQAAFMRNWPYAYSLLDDAAQSGVAGRFGIAPFPGTAGGAPTAALGGSVLAINAHSEQPGNAYALIAFLLEPEQMIERAAVAGQYPTRPALYSTTALADALTVPPAEARRIIDRAVARPVTPVYSQLSDLLQVSLHRALTRQLEPRDALRQAAAAMRLLLARVELAPA